MVVEFAAAPLRPEPLLLPVGGGGLVPGNSSGLDADDLDLRPNFGRRFISLLFVLILLALDCFGRLF